VTTTASGAGRVPAGRAVWRLLAIVRRLAVRGRLGVLGLVAVLRLAVWGLLTVLGLVAVLRLAVWGLLTVLRLAAVLRLAVRGLLTVLRLAVRRWWFVADRRHLLGRLGRDVRWLLRVLLRRRAGGRRRRRVFGIPAVRRLTSEVGLPERRLATEIGRPGRIGRPFVSRGAETLIAHGERPSSQPARLIVRRVKSAVKP
jgi:hypothetical protein